MTDRRKEYGYTQVTLDLDHKIGPDDYVKWTAQDCLERLLWHFGNEVPCPRGRWRIDMRIVPFEFPKE